jgi:lysophospholipase L1-like esterase
VALALSANAPARAQATAHGADVLGPLSRDRILFLGASYTWGLGAIPHTAGYAYQVGRDLGWPVLVDGASGTGFLNPGLHDQGTFADRVTRASTAFDPGLVVLQGGRNDIGYPPARLREAVVRTVQLARDRFRHAQVALLGPIPAELPISRGTAVVDEQLRAAARAARAPYIDPVAEGWMTPANVIAYAGPVPLHPNNAGYAFIAGRLTADIRTLISGAAPARNAPVRGAPVDGAAVDGAAVDGAPVHGSPAVLDAPVPPDPPRPGRDPGPPPLSGSGPSRSWPA